MTETKRLPQVAFAEKVKPNPWMEAAYWEWMKAYATGQGMSIQGFLRNLQSGLINFEKKRPGAIKAILDQADPPVVKKDKAAAAPPTPAPEPAAPLGRVLVGGEKTKAGKKRK